MAGVQWFEFVQGDSHLTVNVCAPDSEEEMDTTPAPAAAKAKKAGMVKAKEESEEEDDDDEDDDDDDDEDEEEGMFFVMENVMWSSWPNLPNQSNWGKKKKINYTQLSSINKELSQLSIASLH